MKRLSKTLMFLLLTLLLSASAVAQGIPARVAALEKKVADLEKALRTVDQGSGLVRTFLERHTLSNNTVTPAFRTFTDRGPIAAVIIPSGSGVPGNPPFVVVNGASAVAYTDCATFSMQGRLVVSNINVARCPSPSFEVLYLFSGPPF